MYSLVSGIKSYQCNWLIDGLLWCRGVRALAAPATTSFAAGRQLQPATAMAKDLWVTAESKQKVAQWVSNLGLGDIIGTPQLEGSKAIGLKKVCYFLEYVRAFTAW